MAEFFNNRRVGIGMLVLWCLLIFIFSGIPNLSSGLREDFLFRKVAHIVEYTVLTLLFYGVFKQRNGEIFFNVFLSVLWSLAYAFSDEVHQTFVFGRSGNFFDVGIDLAGIVLGALFVLIWDLKKKKRKT